MREDHELAPLSVRLPREVRDRLGDASRRETRTLSHQARRYIERGLVADGYLSASDDAPTESP